jgi:hypothetical protein
MKRMKYVRLPKPVTVRVELGQDDLRILRAAIDALKDAVEVILLDWGTPEQRVAAIHKIAPLELKIGKAIDEWVRREGPRQELIEQRKRRSR